MKKGLLLLILISVSSWAWSQKTLIEQNTHRFDSLGTKGPNLKNYTHIYGFYGPNFGPAQTGSEIRVALSSMNGIGLRYKRRFNQVFSGIAEIEISGSTYDLKQNNTKTVPDTVLHKKEKLIFNQIGGGVYLRTNFDIHRGNYLGAFLDLGVKGGYNFNSSNIYLDEDQNTGINKRTKRYGYSYYEPLYYSAYARAGYNQVSVFFIYQRSALFIGHSR